MGSSAETRPPAWNGPSIECDPCCRKRSGRTSWPCPQTLHGWPPRVMEAIACKPNAQTAPAQSNGV